MLFLVRDMDEAGGPGLVAVVLGVVAALSALRLYIRHRGRLQIEREQSSRSRSRSLALAKIIHTLRPGIQIVERDPDGHVRIIRSIYSKQDKVNKPGGGRDDTSKRG